MNSTSLIPTTEMGTTSNTPTTSRQKTNSQCSAEVSTGTPRLVPTLSTHPLVSVAASALVVGLLYLPRCLISLLLSPVSVSTFLLLAALLHFGSSSSQPDPQSQLPELRHHLNSEQEENQRPSLPCAATLGLTQKPVFSSEHCHFLEWARRGPLEVIYEECDGEEEQEQEGVVSPGCEDPDDSDEDWLGDCSRVSSRAWGFPEDLCWLWEEEEEGLIEIPLEEDNLIEIDLSSCR